MNLTCPHLVPPASISYITTSLLLMLRTQNSRLSSHSTSCPPGSADHDGLKPRATSLPSSTPSPSGPPPLHSG